MRKTIRRLAAWACCLCMAAGAVTAAWAQETDYAQMERELVEAQRQQLTGGEPLLTRQDVLPAGQSSVADWYAIAMARCGIGEDYETYLAALKTYVESAYAENGGLSANKATEWHRVALAVTALGGDAAAFGTKPDGTTIDLIADGCYDCVVEGGPGAQGLNGWIFALLALDAGGYQAPEGARYTRETIIEAIVSAQGEDGGFSLTGDALDADITAMALQALAPYADGQAEVIDRALAALSAAQCADGGFASWGAENAESTAQVVMALCALGIDPAADERFCKEGGSAVTALLGFRVEDGSFAHVGGTSDAMASEQGLQALEALRRFYAGEKCFFDMTDAGAPVQWTADSAAAEETAGVPAAVYMAAGAAVVVAAGIVIVRKGRGSHE